MQTKPIFAALLATAFALPFAANAGTDKTTGVKPASEQATPATASNDGGAEAMFKSMDKNGDGFISKEEAAGTPHGGAQFTLLDKNGDGKLSREEHAAAPEHVAGSAKTTGATGSSATTSSTSGTQKTY